MAINITKAKVVKKPKLEKAVVEEKALADKEVTEYSLEELADAYGSLQDEIQALQANPVFEQFKNVDKELKRRLEEQLEPTDSATIEGVLWNIDIGACGKNNRRIKPEGIPQIQEFVGAEAFAQIASVTLKDAEKYLSPTQFEAVVDTDTGYSKTRKITAKYKGE